MAKVIQVRDVPDDVRDALAEAAADEGLSLSRYVRRELERVARQRAAAAHNQRVIRDHQARVAALGPVPAREDVSRALHEGREERADQLIESDRPGQDVA